MKDKKKKVDHTSAISTVVALIVTAVLCLIVGSNEEKGVEETVSLQLKGSDIVYLYVGENYKEYGYIANGSVTGDISGFVTINDEDVNTSYPGVYDVTYKLDFNGAKLEKSRKVKVVNKPVMSEDVIDESEEPDDTTVGKNDSLKVDTTDRIKIKLKGYSHVYLLKGMSFTDDGVLAVTDSGKDVTDTVVKEGSVDVNKSGTYTIVYKVTDSSGKSASVKRVVDVMDMSVTATVSTNEKTNRSVILKVVASADKFSHMIMPDGVKNKSNVGEYIVEQNGKYSFEVVNEYGLSTTYVYVINNIDKTAPSGSCSGYTTGKKSFITVSAKDNDAVAKYMIGNNTYNSSSIELNEVVPKPTIVIYDVVGNTKSITCELENRYTYVPSDPSFKFSYSYINDGTSMPYGLFTPSNISQNEETPLLVWLHGSGEVGTGQGQFDGAGLVKVLNNWNLDGFNAYVICPHLTGSYRGSWANQTSLKNLNALIDKFIASHKIDKDKIMLSGHSMGGLGSMYVAYHSPDRYSSLAVMSGYNPGVDLNGIKIPTVGYVGTPAAGEDSSSYNFTVGTFKNRFGEANTFVRNATHGGLPRAAYTEDLNKDNKSDLMEWMLSQ